MRGGEETAIRVRYVGDVGIHFQNYYDEKCGSRLWYPKLFSTCVNVQQKAIVPAEICHFGGQVFKNFEGAARNDVGGPAKCR